MCTPSHEPVRLVALDSSPTITVVRTLMVLGRHPHCDVRLHSTRVSRHHCCLSELGGELLVRDLGSTNGTRINGHRVSAGRLRPGDELCVADVRFRVERDRPPEATRSEPYPEAESVYPPSVAPRDLA